MQDSAIAHCFGSSLDKGILFSKHPNAEQVDMYIQKLSELQISSPAKI